MSLRIFKTVRRWRFLDGFIEAALAITLMFSPVLLAFLAVYLLALAGVDMEGGDTAFAWFCMLSVLFVVPGLFLLFGAEGWMRRVALQPGASRGTLAVGDDGLRATGLFMRRFVPWHEVEDIRGVDKKFQVVVRLRGGRTIRFRVPDLQEVHQEFVSRHAAALKRTRASPIGALRDAKRDLPRWVEQVRNVVSGGYRSEGATPDVLIRVAEDPTADAEAAALTAFAALSPQSVEACACCDGTGDRTVVGWSASGRSALIKHQGWAACENQRRLEVWRAGAAEPAHCFDLYSDSPDTQTSCDLGSLTAEYAMTEAGRTPRTSTRTRSYPTAPQAIARRHLLVTLARAVTDDDFCPEARTLRVALRSAPTEPLLSAPLCLGARDDVAGDMAEGEWMPNAIEVTVYPAPSGGRALVLYRGDNSAPGMGFFGTTVRWARLPAALRDPTALAPLLTADVAAGTETALPAPGPRAPRPARRFANRYNRAGLVHHRAGRFDEAAKLFFRAVRRDPGHLMAWYNLACAEARRGRPERALGILRILDAWDCAGWAERIRRTATDPDFASMMGDAELRGLVQANAERAAP